MPLRHGPDTNWTLGLIAILPVDFPCPVRGSDNKCPIVKVVRREQNLRFAPNRLLLALLASESK